MKHRLGTVDIMHGSIVSLQLLRNYSQAGFHSIFPVTRNYFFLIHHQQWQQ